MPQLIEYDNPSTFSRASAADSGIEILAIARGGSPAVDCASEAPCLLASEQRDAVSSALIEAMTRYNVYTEAEQFNALEPQPALNSKTNTS